MSDIKPKVTYIKENTVGSMLADTFTFASICGAFWFNYTFIGGNDLLDLLLFLCFFIVSIGTVGNVKRLKELEKEDHK